MIEKNPSGPPDAMPHIIEEIIRTMQLGDRILRLDALQQPSEAHIAASETEPPGVDFTVLAHEVVAKGLFAAHPHMPEAHKDLPTMPQELLDIPYSNGPAHIALGGDLPVVSMETVRGGFIRANRIVLQSSLVGAYFHRRFAAHHPLLSPGIINTADEFNAESFYLKSATAPPDSKSFKIEGVDRTTTDRQLFTRDEQIAAVELAGRHPEVVLALSTYQGTIVDYLCELGVALDKETTKGNLALSQPELMLFANYINEWRTNNFYQEFLPSIALFLHDARIRQPNVTDDELITTDLLHNAVDFVIQNGGFRRYMTIPADVAADHKERVNKFVCPAVNIIREHLVDGRLLQEIYGYLRDQSIDGDSLVTTLTGNIRRNVLNTNPEWYGHPPRQQTQ